MNVLAAALVAITMSGQPLPDHVPRIVEAGCPIPELAARACTWPGGPMYVPEYGADSNWARYAIKHELGHQFDYQVMSDAARDKFRELIDEPRPWHYGPNSAAEKFAEAYALCATRESDARWDGHIWGAYKYAPTVRRHRRLCLLIRRAAAFHAAGGAQENTPTPNG